MRGETSNNQDGTYTINFTKKCSKSTYNEFQYLKVIEAIWSDAIWYHTVWFYFL